MQRHNSIRIKEERQKNGRTLHMGRDFSSMNIKYVHIVATIVIHICVKVEQRSTAF